MDLIARWIFGSSRFELTAAIHVYGGDFFETPRSEWDPDSLEETPYNVEKTLRLFEESNARWDEIRAGG